MLRREAFALRAGDAAARLFSRVRSRFGKGPVEGWGDAMVKFRSRTIGLVSHAWKRLTVATVVSHLSLYAVLLIALRHIGVSDDEVDWAEILAVFAFVRLLTAIPITPGGLGVVELGLIAVATYGSFPSPSCTSRSGITTLPPWPRISAPTWSTAW